jgi:DivIVA domain-containing protein
MTATPSDKPPAKPRRRGGPAQRVRNPRFPLAVRGYDRRAVDEYVAQVTKIVEELDGRQLRENVVQSALDQVGEETAGILRRAHETADELTARSRAQAEGRIQRAEREADTIRGEADKYAQQVVVDTRRLWEQRQRLIEDVRRLADEVLATADDAMERMQLPTQLRDEHPTPAEQPTGEVEAAARDGREP